MNQKEMMLQGSSTKAKAHTITVGYATGFGVFYGYSDAGVGSLHPDYVLGTKVTALYTLNLGSTVYTVIVPPLSVKITRLDTGYSVITDAGGITNNAAFFTDSDVGKTIDLIIEAV